MKGWSEVQFDFAKKYDRESKKLGDDNSLTYSQSLNHTDYWFAMKCVTGVPKVGLSSACAGLLWKNGAWDFWARGSFMRKVLGAGCTHRLNSDTTLSNEFIYDMKMAPTKKGIMGSPLFWRYGAVHKAQNLVMEYRLMAADKSLTMT